jgi:hypothetical protein
MVVILLSIAFYNRLYATGDAMIRRRLTLGAAVLATMMLAVPAAATAEPNAKSAPPAPAIPKGASPTKAESAASALMRWLDAHPRSGAGGVSVEAGTVVVPWKGPVPAEFSTLAGNQPVPVRFVDAPYSATELLTEAERVAKANQQLIADVGPRNDYSGLVVELSNSTTIPADQAVQQIGSTVPVTVRGRTELSPAFSRDGDVAPFYGASLIFRFTSATAGVACSSGVAGFVGSTSVLTTAWHCGTGTWTGYASGATIGTVGARSQAKDTQLISGASTDGRVYTGPWNSTTSTPVFDAERPANNTGICTSGGVTGEVCPQVFVRGTNMFANIGGVGTTGPGFWILSEGSSNNAQIGNIQPGDSGSPAYAYTSSSQASVRGLVVAVDTSFSTANCRGNPNFVPSINGCFARSFAVNVVDALAAVGATIKVGS